MSIHPVFIARVESGQQKEACFAIRREVFVTEQGFPDEEEVDALDAVCDHYLVMQEEEAIATARVILQSDCIVIGRLAVRMAHRGQGIARMLMRRMLADIRTNMPGSIVEVGAQVRAQAFYAKFGFTPYGALYDDTGVTHIHMRHNLAKKNVS